MNAHKYTGGCLCGTIRYGFDTEPANPDICHCRMCQKATGSLFGPYASIPTTDLKWLRGSPKYYRSSPVAERGFCAGCGATLTFAYLDSPNTGISLGSLDDPTAVKPLKQISVESRAPWFEELAGLPGTRSEEDIPEEYRTKIEAFLNSNRH